MAKIKRCPLAYSMSVIILLFFTPRRIWRNVFFVGCASIVNIMLLFRLLMVSNNSVTSAILGSKFIKQSPKYLIHSFLKRSLISVPNFSSILS